MRSTKNVWYTCGQQCKAQCYMYFYETVFIIFVIVQVLCTTLTLLCVCKDNAQLFKLCCTEGNQSRARNKILKRGLFRTLEGQYDGDFGADLTSKGKTCMVALLVC